MLAEKQSGSLSEPSKSAIVQNLLEESKRLKIEGNSFFVSQNYDGAEVAYKQALKIVQNLYKNNRHDKKECRSSKEGEAVASSILLNEIVSLKVALYSNEALVLHKLNRNEEAEELCSSVLIENSYVNLKDRAKLWYRRAQARAALKKYSEAEGDLQICLSLLLNQEQNGMSGVVNKNKNKEIQETKGLLAAIQKEKNDVLRNLESNSANCSNYVTSNKTLTGGNNVPIPTEMHTNLTNLKQDSLIIKNEGKCDDAGMIVKQSDVSKFEDTQGHRIHRNNPAYTSSPPLSSRRSSSKSRESLRSSPDRQKEDILNLLSQSPQRGEGFFIINFLWWKSWCLHVNFFWDKEYSTLFNTIKSNEEEKLKEMQCLEGKRQEVLNLLPRGSILPEQTYWNTNKKGKKSASSRKLGNSSMQGDEYYSDISTSSEEDGDGNSHDSSGNQTTYAPHPGIIDNSILMLQSESGIKDNTGHTSDFYFREWRHGIVHRTKGKRKEESLHLKTCLVRGHNYEVLPREVYAALRCWYGESTKSICRRTEGLNDKLQIRLYPAIHVKDNPSTSSATSTGEIIHFCAACKSSRARSRCTSCMSVYYCDRSCQASHWLYHKPICKRLSNRSDQQTVQKVTNARGFSSALLENPTWGRVGLNNLGNTCFMNAALQCLSHSSPLTRHFLTNRFKKDVNLSNPLGTRGELANAYEILIKELWMSGSRSMSPTALKRAISRFAPRFAGVSQHDSQEFLAFLLDGLHEDLNTVHNPPYIEKADITRGEELTIAGAVAWDAHCLRNMSIVMDSFYGQFKSTCVCPKCNQISVSFDVFNHISLEIPQRRDKKVTIPVILFRAALSKDDQPSPPVRYGVSIARTESMEDVRQSLSQLCGIHHTRLTLCDIYENTIYEFFTSGKKIAELGKDDLIGAFEVDPYAPSTMHAIAIHVNLSDSNGADSKETFGYPLLTSFHLNLTCHQVWNHIWRQISHLLQSENDHFDPETKKSSMQIRIVDNQGLPRSIFREINKNTSETRLGLDVSSVLPLSDRKLSSFLGANCADSFLFIQIEWRDAVDFVQYSNHSSLVEAIQQQQQPSGNLTLDDCFSNFTRPEHLDEENKWYCSNCKEHVRAMKTMELWRLPNILIVHLKRFEYKNALRRDKLESFVHCPLENLNMSKHCASSSDYRSNYEESVPRVDDFDITDIPADYDLFAITNHYGRMGFGHYTAVARRWFRNEIENEWSLFDDSTVVRVGLNGSEIVTSAAYVLFYRRRVFA